MKLRLRAVHFCYLNGQINLEYLKCFDEQVGEINLDSKNTIKMRNYLGSILFFKFVHQNISEISNIICRLNNGNGQHALAASFSGVKLSYPSTGSKITIIWVKFKDKDWISPQIDLFLYPSNQICTTVQIWLLQTL